MLRSIIARILIRIASVNNGLVDMSIIRKKRVPLTDSVSEQSFSS